MYMLIPIIILFFINFCAFFIVKFVFMNYLNFYMFHYYW